MNDFQDWGLSSWVNAGMVIEDAEDFASVEQNQNFFQVAEISSGQGGIRWMINRQFIMYVISADFWEDINLFQGTE